MEVLVGALGVTVSMKVYTHAGHETKGLCVMITVLQSGVVTTGTAPDSPDMATRWLLFDNTVCHCVHAL